MGKQMRLTAFLFSLMLMLSGCSDGNSAMQIEDEPENIEILFIGNSFLMWGNALIPEEFTSLAQAAGKKVIMEKYIHGGKTLDFISTSAPAEEKINRRFWDYVILQGSPFVIAFPDSHHIINPQYGQHLLREGLERLIAKIKNKSPKAKILYFMPWAYEDGVSWIPGRTESYTDMQMLIISNTLTETQGLNLSIAPVGYAWNEVMQEGPDDHYLFDRDFSHPSERGSYLGACVVFASVYGRYGDPTPDIGYYANLPKNEALHFQIVGINSVLDRIGMWRIR